MSGNPGGLNPGASTWVPGQAFVPRSQQQQPQQGQQGDSQQGYPQYGGNAPYGYFGGQQQQPGGFNGPQGGYPYGGGGYPQYSGGYGQQGGGYGGGYGGYRGPPQGGAYVPPQQRYQQQQQQAPSPSAGSALPPPPSSVPDAERPAGQTIKLNIGGTSSGSSTPPPTGQTVRLNIGGSKPATPALAPEKKEEKPAATTIKLNIGGGSKTSGTATPPQLPTVNENKASDSTAAATAAGKKSAALNFSVEKAKNDADAIAEEHARVADEETLKDLYGEREKAEDENGQYHQTFRLCLPPTKSIRSQAASQYCFHWSCRCRQVHDGRSAAVPYWYGGQTNHGEV